MISEYSEPRALQQAGLTILPNQSECVFHYPLFDSAKMFCAIDSNKTRLSNACSGDSGSPLVYSKNGRWFVYGVTSFVLFDTKNTDPACDPSKPVFLAKVISYLEWIWKSVREMEQS